MTRETVEWEGTVPPDLTRPQAVRVDGVAFASTTVPGVVDFIRRRLASGHGGRLVTPNMQMLASARRDASLTRMIEAHDLVVADGMPIVWASRLSGASLPGRVAGADLVPALASLADAQRLRVFFLGGAPGTAEAAVRVFRESYPNAEVVGVTSPSIASVPSAEQMHDLRHMLTAARPDLVFVSLGFPKQEFVSRELAAGVPGAWFLNIGMGLGYFAGERRRAPKFIQRVGMEWVWRLAGEPTRLARRYLLHSLPHAVRLLCRSLPVRRSR